MFRLMHPWSLLGALVILPACSAASHDFSQLAEPACGDASTNGAEASTRSGEEAGNGVVASDAGPPYADAGVDGAPHDEAGGSPEAGATCDNPSLPQPPTDIDYRVIVQNVAGADLAFPSSSTSWQLRYAFTVPPLPCSSTWNHTNQTFYVWGDVDFDDYGPNGTWPLHDYDVSQIVPQIMVGNALDGNDAAYHVSFQPYTTWVMQAQYYWHSAPTNTDYAQTGKVIPVNVGDVVTTEIDYFASTGLIRATISTATGASSIDIARPFPNENPPLYASWRDFFQQAEAQSTSLRGEPVVNVETHYVDEATICPMLPFDIEAFSVPGTFTASQLQTTGFAGLTCPHKLANLGF